MQMHEVMRARRDQLRLSQADLAAAAGTSERQIRKYESGDVQPSFAAAARIARALGISLDALAGDDTGHLTLTGEWWACWQSWQDGRERANPHQVRMTQRGDLIEVVAISRGTPFDEGGYMWRGEMHLHDNRTLMGWYIATEAAVRSHGTMFFHLHQHGVTATGRWVGESYDGPIVSGWAALAHTEAEVTGIMNELLTRDPRTGNAPA